jgi:hypothetical protein
MGANQRNPITPFSPSIGEGGTILRGILDSRPADSRALPQLATVRLTCSQDLSLGVCVSTMEQ